MGDTILSDAIMALGCYTLIGIVCSVVFGGPVIYSPVHPLVFMITVVCIKRVGDTTQDSA